MDLNNKVALIIGASSGIGEGIVRAIDEARPRGIVLAARRREKLEEIARTLVSDTLIVPTDIQDYESVDHLIDKVIKRYSRIDIVINSAGLIQRETNLEELSGQAIKDIVETNLIGALYVGRAVLPHFLKQGNGVMVMISSIAGINAYPNEETYCGSKAGVDHYIRALDERLKDLRSNGNNIYAFSVGPGFIDTVEARRQFPEAPEDMWEKTPKPLDFGRIVVSYLANPKVKYSENGAVCHIETVDY